MTNTLWEMLGFAGKGLVVIIVVAICSAIVFSRARRGRGPAEGRLRIRRMDDQFRELVANLRAALLPPKQRRKALKQAAKAPPVSHGRNVFVLDFKGDLMASAVEALRDEVTAILEVVQPRDEVVLRLESGGGAAHSYGFAASQLARFNDAEVPLTVCVDRVAASGGYMMACVANKIVAAPFAIIGSIGVAAPLPNVHRLLDKLGVDYENATAGRFKRTVSPFTAVDPEGRAKFQEEIELVHDLFKGFVNEHRPELDIEAVATGESWQAKHAAKLGLVDELMTSDAYLMKRVADADLYELEVIVPSKVRQRLGRL